MTAAVPVFLEAKGIDEFASLVDELEGEFWVSCTAPLKHSPQRRLGVSGPDGVDAINQLMRKDGAWSGTSTDGVGFVAACRHIGIEPRGCVLRMRGGDARIGIDLDTAPAGGESSPLDAEIQVSISYGDGATVDEFGVIMVTAQHLEAWKLLFAPERVGELPSLSLLLENLYTTG